MSENFLPPNLYEENDEKNEKAFMSWAGHLSEVRARLLKVFLFFILAFCCLYPFAEYIRDILLLPLAQAMEKTGGSQRVIFTGLAEGFLTHIKLSAFSAVFLTFPFFAYQVWRFLVPALYAQERVFLRFIFLASPVLFCIGALFVFYILMPLAFGFLLSFQQLQAGENLLPIVLESKLNEYFSFLISLILAFGISFQLPIVLVILGKIGLISALSLKKLRRYAILFIFIVSAILTPPDVVSQVVLAIPLLILYELSIYCIQCLEKKRNQEYK